MCGLPVVHHLEGLPRTTAHTACASSRALRLLPTPHRVPASPHRIQQRKRVVAFTLPLGIVCRSNPISVGQQHPGAIPQFSKWDPGTEGQTYCISLRGPSALPCEGSLKQGCHHLQVLLRAAFLIQCPCLYRVSLWPQPPGLSPGRPCCPPHPVPMLCSCPDKG